MACSYPHGTGEMALLVEGLGIGGETSIEEYIIGPADDLADDQEPTAEKDKFRLYGPEAGLSWVAKPVTEQSSLALVSRHGSMTNQSVPFMDPLVTLFGSLHEKLLETGNMPSALFPNFGSMFSNTEPHLKDEHWDVESLERESGDYASEASGGASDDNLHSPLLSRQTTSLEKDMVPPHSHGSILSMRRNSTLIEGTGEQVADTGIGGGWQLAWKWSEKGAGGKKEGEFKRIYLHQEGVPGPRHGSTVSLPGNIPVEGEFIQAAALVSQPALYSKELIDQHPVGPAMVHPSENISKIPIWTALCDPGVKRALFVGIGIQILQQVIGHIIFRFLLFFSVRLSFLVTFNAVVLNLL